MKRFFLIVGVLVSVNLFAQEFSSLNLNTDLKKDANVIVREYKLDLNIKSPSAFTETRKEVITILNETGSYMARQIIPYSSLSRLERFKGFIYDKGGSKVRQIKINQAEDVSASGNSLYTDDRYKVLDFEHPTYPYTILLEYKIDHQGQMFYPSWRPQNRPTTAVEQATMIVTVPESLNINYFENLVEVSKESSADNKIYTWEIDQIPGFEPEPYSPPMEEQLPFVWVTPNKFEMEGLSGSMSSWSNIGAWAALLRDNSETLPEGAAQDIIELTAGIDDELEKTRIVYDYMQNNTRYVSVQLGIGGWKPFDATYVYENGFGDCKALTNYTSALLKHVGIESEYVLVKAGSSSPDINLKVPNAYFNHAILAVPLDTDTVWLECTSQKSMFGFIGSFTSDRHVLIAKNDGSTIVKTPGYNESDNLQLRVAQIEIDEKGVLSARADTRSKAEQFEFLENQLYRSPQDQKEHLLKSIEVPQPRIKTLKYEYFEEDFPVIVEHIELTAAGYANVSNQRIFFKPNVFNKWNNIPKKIIDRQTDIIRNLSFTDIDSLVYKLPEGYHAEFVPEEVHIQNEFGEYKLSYTFNQHELIFVRKLTMKKGRFPAKSYQKFRDMIKDIVRKDNQRIVLVGKT